MKLNKECIRDILLYVEEKCIYYNHPNVGHRLYEVTFNELSNTKILSKYTKDDMYYTVQKLFEGNYIKGYTIPENHYDNFDYAYIQSLSLKGHNLLDNIRPEPVWNQTKRKLEKVGGFSLKVMSQIAGEIMTTYVKSMTQQS